MTETNQLMSSKDLVDRELDRVWAAMQDGLAEYLREPMQSTMVPILREALVEAERAQKPTTREVAMKWLIEMCSGFPVLPDGKALDRLLQVFWRDSGGLPAGVWTQESMQDARRTFDFLPSSAKLYKFLHERAQPILRKRRLIEYALNRPVRGPVEVEVMADKSSADATRDAVVRQLRRGPKFSR